MATAAFFHAALAPGPAEIRTEVVRRGRNLAVAQAQLIQDDREVLRVLASFADLELAEGRTLELGRRRQSATSEHTSTLIREAHSQAPR